MQLVKRAVAIALGTALAIVWGNSPADAQNKEIRGSALAVSDSSLTVRVGDQTLSFAISRDTLIEARGASTRTRRAESAGKSPGIKVSDYVKPGDPVLVSYRPISDGKNLALTVRPISAVGTSGTSSSVKNVQGKVKSINGNKLVLDQDGRAVTLTVDRDTDVLAPGGTRATNKAGGRLPITDFVHAGDIVRVQYREADGAMTALQIQVRSLERRGGQ